MKHLISMRDLSADKTLQLLKLAESLEKDPSQIDLSRRVMAAMFYEASTRTRMSFESAMKRLGGEVIGMVGTSGTSVEKGETLADTAKIMARYSDIIVMRHPMEGAARYVSEQVDVPVVNAGDGANQHPTQSLLDLYTILKSQGTLKGLKLALVGDLKYGRTVHSLAYALAPFNPTFYFVSPKSLRMPAHILSDLTQKGVSYKEKTTVENIIPEIDIMYVTRIQRERFPDREEYEKVKNAYIITANLLRKAKDNMKVLHPLPRVNEITTDVDSTKYAYYFDQAENGVYMRQAILATLLGEAK
ncbi:MAG: aspartate carbamoyltransferase [Candidatus Marinimicrobia bacterium]|jgi:aspartate carbamoyltransferase catalytic subunit|nr:aspartate carbamoyltransferase [Candidatus Neomarinimicrobiota bacterium]MBT4359636.1 aspartate carbamoyltransferase [Candidatus Neomarinimicrobiota bacterium]MBT4713615.1 aspartate carbamoyltransferase [Candidatus Neomarinimicrobiota bacterium]MBT4947102.1 aspartate carbamoyltransferase [Candidatus Neomarinimicrobiota bacterium]MBT5271374.1 aspartate carbamoyltransferase [Candidatus Neomarinimicrobiota bacterium]